MSSRRLPFVIALVVLIALAIAAGNASARSTAPRPNPAAANPAGASGVWFCPGLPASLQHGHGRVSFANLGATAADLSVTDLPDSGKSSTVTFSIPAQSTVTKTRDSLGPPGALTVETFGGAIVVEEGVEGSTGASAPCATVAQARQLFAAGSTVRGVHQWLVVENPYASDAKINVTLRTNAGLQQPDSLQGFDISRRSRVVIPVDTVAIRDDRVAVEVDAVEGAIVATQTLEYTPVTGVPGVTVSLGAPAPSDHWTFPGNDVLPHTNAWVAIANVGSGDALVDVQVAPDKSSLVVAPAALTVAQDDVTWIAVGHCGPDTANKCLNVPEGMGFVLTVRSEHGIAIVAQTLSRGTNKAAPVGADAPLGAVDPARHVAFAFSRVGAERSTTLSLFDPGAVAAHVSIGLVHDGRTDRPHQLQSIVVGPGRRVTAVVIGPKSTRAPDAAIVVDSDQPVFVSRTMQSATNVARSGGIVLG